MPVSSSFARRVARTVAAMATTVLVPLALQAQAPRTVIGSYAFEVLSPNGAVRTVMTLEKRGDGVGGTLNAEGLPTVQVVRVTPTDSGAVYEAALPDGESVVLVGRLTPDNRFAGRVTYMGLEMPFAGTFTPTGGAAPGAGVDVAGRLAGETTEPFMGAPSLPFECLITRTPAGAWAGGCAPAGQPHDAAPITAVTVAGSVITASGASPMGPYVLQYTLEGTKATGTISLNGEKAKFAATFTPAAK